MRRKGRDMNFKALAATALTSVLVACGGAGNDAAMPLAQSPVERCVTVSGGDTLMQADQSTLTRETLQLIASSGFDTVRISFPIADYTAIDPPFLIDPIFFSRMDDVVNWALEANLGIILELESFDALEAEDRAATGRFSRIWDQLTLHYFGISDRIMFSLLGDASADMSPERIESLSRLVLSRIRDVDGRRWVILPAVEGGTLDGLGKTAPDYDPRAMVAFSYDRPQAFTRVDAVNSDDPNERIWGSMDEFRAVRADFEQAVGVQDTLRLPVLVSAFGADGDVPTTMRARWTRAVRLEAEMQGLGWCYADFTGDAGLYDPESRSWRPQLVEALFRNGDLLN